MLRILAVRVRSFVCGGLGLFYNLVGTKLSGKIRALKQKPESLVDLVHR